MRGLLAGLIAGVVLGGSGTAIAAGFIAPWHHTTPTYYCYGYQGAAWCKLRYTPYEAFVARNQISIFDVRTKGVIFSCDPGVDPQSDCADYR